MCARYIADQNSVVMIAESGTYAVQSGIGIWLGLVQNHDFSENMGVMNIRYQGNTTRNVNSFIDGPKDFTGTITYYPQDMRMLAYALGSCVDGGSPSPYTHVISEANSGQRNAFTSGTLNPFISFSLEDSKSTFGAAGTNYIRKINGCMVDSFTLNGTQGELITAEVGYVAQNSTFASGTATIGSEDTLNRPYLWSDVKLHVPSGTVLDTLKSFTFSVNNNIEPPHYLNGSRVVSVPYPQNRDYTFECVVDATSERTKTIYESYFYSGTEFNSILDLTASAGSQDCVIIMSGCKMNPVNSPTNVEGIGEQTITFMPKTVTVSMNDLTFKYMPW